MFDSGIQIHPDLGAKRIELAVDFTSGSPVFSHSNGDSFGHGTHVAGIIGGTGKKSNGHYRGVAPGVSFLDIKVIGDDGTGLTSNVIKAIDWLIQNQHEFNIRVANLSLSRPPLDPYWAIHSAKRLGAWSIPASSLWPPRATGANSKDIRRSGAPSAARASIQL